jgi:hypothetical protein
MELVVGRDFAVIDTCEHSSGGRSGLCECVQGLFDSGSAVSLFFSVELWKLVRSDDL